MRERKGKKKKKRKKPKVFLKIYSRAAFSDFYLPKTKLDPLLFLRLLELQKQHNCKGENTNDKNILGPQGLDQQVPSNKNRRNNVDRAAKIL